RSYRNQGAAGTESRSDIVNGHGRGVPLVFSDARGIAAAWAGLQLKQFPAAATKDERSSGKGSGLQEKIPSVLQPKKKKGKVEVRPINLGTDYEYGVLNIHLTAYDMALAERYAQYVHHLCNHLSIKVEESYAMPTKTMEVLRLQDQGNKMLLDSVLTTHERVVQVGTMGETLKHICLSWFFCPFFFFCFYNVLVFLLAAP
uniref:Small ribosomal subunit protein uS10 domain-containing protein n=1 Tax=Canis lupus dingo TaxID=286419 RepID=A0A8C0QTZ0_CANLU